MRLLYCRMSVQLLIPCINLGLQALADNLRDSQGEAGIEDNLHLHDRAMRPGDYLHVDLG